MNWGTKIMIVFGLFVSGILYMVFKAGSHNMDLVTTDYYEQELKYQQTIDAVERTNALSTQVICKVNGSNIDILFPSEMKGKPLVADVWLYCISDKTRDLKKQFTSTDGIVSMPFLPSNKGVHEVKISWQFNGETYYHNQKIPL
jgi:hypothetical protein